MDLQFNHLYDEVLMKDFINKLRTKILKEIEEVDIESTIIEESRFFNNVMAKMCYKEETRSLEELVNFYSGLVKLYYDFENLKKDYCKECK